MAFGLAMHLSGVESEYFYEIGARTIFDAGSRLMSSTIINTFQKPNQFRNLRYNNYNTQRRKIPTNRLQIQSKYFKPARLTEYEKRSASPSTTDEEFSSITGGSNSSSDPESYQEIDTVNQLLSIIQESDETESDIRSECSSSSSNNSGFMGIPKKSNRNKLLTAIMTKPAQGVINAYGHGAVQGNNAGAYLGQITRNVPPPPLPSPLVCTIPTVPPPSLESSCNDWQRTRQFFDVSCPPPVIDHNDIHRLESLAVIQSKLSPIGTKPATGSPIRKPTDLNSNPSTSTSCSPEDTHDQSNQNQSDHMSIFMKPSIWTYQEEKPKPKPPNDSKVMYNGRNVLDLGGNLTDSKWQFRSAELPAGNSKMFFENRSQYHRVATSTNDYNVSADIEEMWEQCKSCDFRYPIVPH